MVESLHNEVWNMKAIFLAPLMLAGCAEATRLGEIPPVPVAAPATTIAVARPAPVTTTRVAPAPRPVPARVTQPTPRPAPAPERPATTDQSAESSTDDSATELATGESVKGCKEGGWWGLVGRPKAAASIISEPKRVYTEGDSVTTDNNPARTNVVVDEAGTIVEVSCG